MTLMHIMSNPILPSRRKPLLLLLLGFSADINTAYCTLLNLGLRLFDVDSSDGMISTTLSLAGVRDGDPATFAAGHVLFHASFKVG